jgi:predicted metalloprotease with PDZ domain/CTP:molybdopterin cytidylyltransferase MocA
LIAPACVGILLAAGRGRRFDPDGARNKLLARLPDGEQVAAASARHLLAVLPEVVAVVPPGDGGVAGLLRALGCRVVLCPDADSGMAASLVCGLRAAHAAQSWVVALADMPHVRPATIAAVRDAVAQGADIALPVFDGRRGNPVAFSRRHLPALLALRGDQGARAIVRTHPVCEVDAADPGVLLDVDTPSDLPKNGTLLAMKKTSNKPRASIQYAIVPKDLAGHLFSVTLVVANPAPDGQVLALPAWIPGSYMIREFARHIVQIRAESGGKPVALTKLDKHSWRAAPVAGPLTVSYEVYAWDLSVRAAHLDQTHGFFNGTSVFLRVLGQEDERHQVDIQQPDHPAARGWRVATSLPELGAPRYGFGTYVARDYDELIDHPVEMGDFALGSFKAHGVQHDIVITGRVPNLDMARLQADLKAICEAQIALFEPRSKRAPMDRYVFMTLAVGDGYGGLEHRASTALICARADLPTTATPKGAEIGEGYLKFLGLCSHEYFHTWNVKRIKPAVFAPYDLQQEVYTPLLWLFEGFTSYYDDLMLVRSGIIGEEAYLKLLGKTIGGVLRGSGRTKQSVAESSFDAWSKYYRQDENAPNAIVSYYAKGSLVGLAFDLTIRARTEGKKSLDDVMRELWSRYGRDFYEGGGRGVTEREVEALFDEVSGLKLRALFDRYVRGTEDIPLAKLYAPHGVKLKDERKSAKPSLDVSVGGDGADAKLRQVHEGGAAHQAGMSAGDVLVALDGIRVTSSNLDSLLSRYRVGDKVAIHAFRRDELMSFEVVLQGDRVPGVTLAVVDPKKKSVRPSAG